MKSKTIFYSLIDILLSIDCWANLTNLKPKFFVCKFLNSVPNIKQQQQQMNAKWSKSNAMVNISAVQLIIES